MNGEGHSVRFRVRYSETDQMQTYYNSRPLEWFEMGRSELLRQLGHPYRQMEAEGFMLPVREAHVEYLGRAQYDDLLEMTSRFSMPSPAQIRIDVEIVQAESRQPVCRGYTVHVTTDRQGKLVRPPQWLRDLAP